MRWLAYKLMRLRGWEFTGEPPPFAKFVAIGAPHTSNWDFIAFLAVVYHFKVRASAIGKHSLVRWPFGRLMRRLGIIPVDRSSSHGLVGQMVQAIHSAESMMLVIAPEGSRRGGGRWKSGFYQIAAGANVPIVMAYVDNHHKMAGLGPALHPSGDLEADMELVREFYEPYVSRFPDKWPITLVMHK